MVSKLSNMFIALTIMFIINGSCLSLHERNYQTPNIILEKPFVFDSDLRRMIISFNSNNCVFKQYYKNKDGYIDNDSKIEIESTYDVINDSLIVFHHFKSSLEKIYKQKDEVEDTKIYSFSNKKFSFWNNDDGIMPCMDTIRILKGKKRNYLYCQLVKKNSYYNFFFMSVKSQKELKKRKIKLIIE